MLKTFRRYRQKLKLVFAIIGVIFTLTSLHLTDISFNMKVINLYSDMRLETEGCILQFPKLWNSDILPNYQMIKMTDLYMLGMNLAIIGIIFLVVAVIL